MILLKVKKGVNTQKEWFTEMWNLVSEKKIFDKSLTCYFATHDKRTFKQNSFYWFAVKHILHARIDNGERTSLQGTHTDLKCMFLTSYDDNGEIKTRLKHPDEIDYTTWGMLPANSCDIPESKMLKKNDFKEYWQMCIKFCNALYGTKIPLNPHDMEEEQYYKYLEETEINK